MSNIKYTVVIDNKECVLTFAFESKNKFYYNSDIHNGLHAFNKPLGAYPIDAEINTGTHTYTLKSKP